jgi:hypothetical protein
VSILNGYLPLVHAFSLSEPDGFLVFPGKRAPASNIFNV